MEWTFAAAQVTNDPVMPGVFRRFITRQSADGCELWVEFRKSGEDGLAMPQIIGRWSSQPEPIRREPVVLPPPVGGPDQPDAPVGGAIQIIASYDIALATASRRVSVAASESGEEVAVAVLRSDGRAFAWGAESYAYPNWEHPDWELQHGTYDVTLKAVASGATVSRRFQLPFLSGDFAQFKLDRLPD